jgi:hypothetical protein
MADAEVGLRQAQRRTVRLLDELHGQHRALTTASSRISPPLRQQGQAALDAAIGAARRLLAALETASAEPPAAPPDHPIT